MKTIILILPLMACSLDPFDNYRSISDTNGVQWRGGNDDYIKCAHTLAREVGEGYVREHGADFDDLRNLTVEVLPYEEWFNSSGINETLLIEGRRTCYWFRDNMNPLWCEIYVNKSMSSLLHEYFEFFFPSWHNLNKDRYDTETLYRYSDKYEFRLASKCSDIEH